MVNVEGISEFSAFRTIEGDAACGILLVCDHAENRLPAEYGNLGLPASEFSRHIAYDPGAAAVTEVIAAQLGAPAVLSTFSRLLIDPNRGEDDPTLIMRLSDGAVVPGNTNTDAAERARRIASFHAPYHAAIDEAIRSALEAGRPPIILSVHSFTPVWRGVPRPWHAGVLWDKDPRFAVPLIEELRKDERLIVGDNEPYAGALRNDTMYRHATSAGLAHALIEVRQDLISDEGGVEEWATRLASIVRHLNDVEDLHVIRRYGSRADD